MTFRTDRNNNPAAFTTDIAKKAGLVLNTDYLFGDPFSNGKYYTAKLLGNPYHLTVRVIDRITFYTASGQQRWSYIAMPQSEWLRKPFIEKCKVIEGMYLHHEGGSGKLSLKNFFMNQAVVVKSKKSSQVYVCFPVPDMKYLEEKCRLEGTYLPQDIPDSDSL